MVSIPIRPLFEVKGNALMLTLHYLDEHIVVVHKPSGLLVHRSNIDKYETRFLLQELRNQIGQQVFPMHRLDKPTSGLMVFALNKEVARTLTQAFTDRTVHKTYLAMVRGFVSDQSIDYPLLEEHDKMTDALKDPNKEAQSAFTELRTLATGEFDQPVGRYPQARYSLVELKPETGRKHQLRRHMSHIRHPIIGDTTHGDGKQNKYAREHFDLNRLALVAYKLAFAHPVTQQALAFEANIDGDLLGAFSVFANRDLSGATETEIKVLLGIDK